MLFNSFIFISLFLPFTVFTFYILAKKLSIKSAVLFLLFASLVFHSFYVLSHTVLLVLSVAANFAFGRIICSINAKKTALVLGLIFNIGLLFYFKYAFFFAENLGLAHFLGLEYRNIILPLGISFFTIQQIAFLVDCYERVAKEEDFYYYSLFVCFFPQLVAGPICHHRDIIPQFKSMEKSKEHARCIAGGVALFIIGLAKKIIIADSLDPIVDQGFSSSTSLNVIESWLIAFCYTFQLYFDFSGYTDMATGIALMFCIDLPRNFDSPFKSRSIIEFWSRWHQSLTAFINAYIFIPILRSFKTLSFTTAMLSTFITFVIAGLWHGASWNFLIFGAIHGIGLVVNHLYNKLKENSFVPELPSIIGWSITFIYVVVGFVFFRAETFSDALSILSAMGQVSSLTLPESIVEFVPGLKEVLPVGPLMPSIVVGNWIYPMVTFVFIIVLFGPNSNQLFNRLTFSGWEIINYSILLIISILLMERSDAFLYFNF